VHPDAISSHIDQPGPSEIREVSRHGGLRQLEAVVDVADAHLVVSKQGENPQTSLVRERLEHRLELIDRSSPLRGSPFHIFALTYISHHAYIRLGEYLGVTYMDTIKDIVQQKYGQAARQARAGQKADCGCDTSCCSTITSDLYDETQAAAIPTEAMLASLGCGNPTALAELKPGEVVLDLGSGGGIDVLLSAKRVGSTGKAYGLDMTDEMLSLARENQRISGLTNVEFLQGEIEHIPLPDNSVDVIISNCVVNLSADKDRVIAEAFRVLRPGGRLAISDIVVRGDSVPEFVRHSMELWVGCIAGALEESSYRGKLARAGFENVAVEATRIYRSGDARQILGEAGLADESILAQIDGRFMSAFVRAQKPVAAVQTCCALTCCA